MLTPHPWRGTRRETGGRETLKEVYKEGAKFGESERVLRVNNLGSEDLKKDLALAKEIELDGIVTGKQIGRAHV